MTVAPLPTDDELRLITNGWKQTRNGKWLHPSLPPVQGRLRPFSTEQALTLTDAMSEGAPRVQ